LHPAVRQPGGLEAAIRAGAVGQFTDQQIIARLVDAPEQVQRAYTYLLGLYLGDGYLSRSWGHGAFRLRISLDQKYPHIIDEARDALLTLLPNNHVGIVPQQIGCVQVSSYSNAWPALFPQHGDGLKHTRVIALED
jgi:hypothetical protein